MDNELKPSDVFEKALRLLTSHAWASRDEIIALSNAYYQAEDRRPEPPRREAEQMVMYCPAGHQHIDKGEWATRPHKTHQCQARIQRFVCLEQDGSERYDAAVCGLEWRPAEFPTVGVAALNPAPSKEKKP